MTTLHVYNEPTKTSVNSAVEVILPLPLASLEGSYARHRRFFDVKGTHLPCELFSHRFLAMLQTVSGNIDSNSTQILLSVG